MFRSRRDSRCHWTFAFSIYDSSPEAIPATFWCESTPHTGTVRVSTMFRMFQSGRWEVRMIGRLYLTFTRIPYRYLLEIPPEELIDQTGDNEDQYAVVAHLLYHPRSPHTHLWAFARQTPEMVRAYATIRRLCLQYPQQRHWNQLQKVHAELSMLPPNQTQSFLGGTAFQSARSSFEAAAAATNASFAV